MSIDFIRIQGDRHADLLEQPALWLVPHEVGQLLHDDTGAAAGLVRVRRRGWWGFGRRLSVHEAFEQPVVFRMRRLLTLWPRWLVEDAEGEKVGTVGGVCVRDRWDRVIFRRD